MNLLAPLGLIGLIGIAVLIFIYIIKPNYQQKFISSTYIWRLSLKYKKKRVPISKLRNLLIFICQLALLANLGFLLARPVVKELTNTPKNERIAVIDASAGMMVESDGKTRFERAAEQISSLADSTLSSPDGAISIIVADTEAYVLVSRARADALTEVKQKLAGVSSGELTCGYGSADIDGAAKLAERILEENSEAEVLLYTATEYSDRGGFTVIDVSSVDDWNAAVLDCKPVLLETNEYSFSVDLGCFGRSKAVAVSCELFGVNKSRSEGGSTGAGVNLSATKTEYFTDADNRKDVEFTKEDFGSEAILTFEYMYVHIDEADGFSTDNTFNVYGGTRPVLRIQYASTTANNFFSGALRSLRQSLSDRYTVEIATVGSSSAKTEGFDLYIFEHKMPDVMPTDGVVMLVDPDRAPEGSGLEFGGVVAVDSSSRLASGRAHPLTTGINPERITVAKYNRITSSDGFEELMYYNGDTVMAVKNTDTEKVVLLTLDLNNSSFGISLDFPIFMYNLFNYFFPATLTGGNAYEVGDLVTVNARGSDMTLDGPGLDNESFDSLPATVRVNIPGDYTVSQTNMNGDRETEQFFVRIPVSESDITKTVDALPTLGSQTTIDENITDLLMWFSAAALLLLCVEWLLHSRETL